MADLRFPGRLTAYVVILVLMSAPHSLAQSALSWGETVAAKLKTQTGLPLSMLVTSDEGADPPFLEDLSNEVFIRLSGGGELNFMMKLNRDRLGKDSGIGALAKLSRERFILVADLGSNWQFLQATAKGAQEVFETRGPSAYTDPSIVADWLFSKLGWDGIVLAKDGDKVLVGSSRGKLKRDNLQAIAIQNSEKQIQITTKRGSGALLSLTSSEGPYAIFRVIFMGEGKSIPVGTKLIFEAVK